MLSRGCAVAVLAIVTIAAGSALVAQSALAQLGLTETAARTFLLDEIKAPAEWRRDDIVVAGTRGFYKLPPAARGPAATALFAWAKSYVNSPAFKTAYATFRKQAIPDGKPNTTTIDDAIKEILDKQRAAIEQARQTAKALPPDQAAKLLSNVKQMEAELNKPETIAQTRRLLELQRAGKQEREDESVKRFAVTLPADPQVLFARRLREFLDATADVDFSTRMITLLGGGDGIEFVDPAARKRFWLWQEAVIVGREATLAARAAAGAWLKEVGR